MTMYKDARYYKLRNGDTGVRFASDEPIKLHQEMEIDIYQNDDVQTVRIVPFWTTSDGEQHIALARIVRQ